MAVVIKSNDTWAKDPSGSKQGDLKAWRDGIYAACPNPSVGDIVVMHNTLQDKKYGYRCIVPDGYDTRWERVSQSTISEGCGYGYIQGAYTPINDQTRPYITETSSGIPCTSEGVYLGDGVYIDPEDCWF